MKKLLIVATLLLFAGFTYGQSLKKGCIVGVHHITITLKDGATMDQFLAAFESWAAEASKLMKGWNAYLVKGNKGAHANEYGLVWYIDSKEAHDRYLNKDNSWTEEGNSLVGKIQPYLDELEKYGTWTSEFTDWMFL